MKKYLPIKIFSIRHGYGWWWYKYTFFFKNELVISPIWWEAEFAEYAKNGKKINYGDNRSWKQYNEQF